MPSFAPGGGGRWGGKGGSNNRSLPLEMEEEAAPPPLLLTFDLRAMSLAIGGTFDGRGRARTIDFHGVAGAGGGDGSGGGGGGATELQEGPGVPRPPELQTRHDRTSSATSEELSLTGRAGPMISPDVTSSPCTSSPDVVADEIARRHAREFELAAHEAAQKVIIPPGPCRSPRASSPRHYLSPRHPQPCT